MAAKNLNGEHKLLRIFIGESDFMGHKPLYVELLERARKAELAGCTVLRGIAGFGANSVVHSSTGTFKLSRDLPIIIEIVDTVEHIKDFLKEVEPLLVGGLVTEEKVTVHYYQDVDKEQRI